MLELEGRGDGYCVAGRPEAGPAAEAAGCSDGYMWARGKDVLMEGA